MKPAFLVLFLAAAVASPAAQNPAPKKQPSPVPSPPPAHSKDVVVDISDSAISDDFETKEIPAPPLSSLSSPPTPAPEKQAVAEDAPAAAGPATAEPEGVQVHVEPGKSGAPVDAAKIKLLAPFPPKALSKAPAGWRLEHPEDAPPLEQEVTLDNGAHLTLSIRPHVLVPDADGRQVIAISEPGFDSQRQYEQAKTVGAALANSLEQMDKQSKNLGDALDRLQQLMTSLPHPAATAPAPAKPAGNPR